MRPKVAEQTIAEHLTNIRNVSMNTTIQKDYMEKHARAATKLRRVCACKKTRAGN